MDDGSTALLGNAGKTQIRRERVFREHADLLAHDDDWLISQFRFARAVLLDLCAELGPALERATRRSRAITTLGFLGSYQQKMSICI